MRRPERMLTKNGCGKPGNLLRNLTFIVFSLLLATLSIASFTAPARAQDGGETAPVDGVIFQDDFVDYVPGEVLVKFADNTVAERIEAFFGLIGIEGFKQKIEASGAELFALLQLKAGVSVEVAIHLLEGLAGVIYAEPNYYARAAYAPSDPDYQPEQWGLNNYGQPIEGQAGVAGADISAQEAWDIEQGWSDPVTVAVIDSGIDATHPDLDGKIWDNADEVPDNDIDDDGNGYVDDVSGFNWAGITQSRFYYYDYNDEMYYTTARFFGSQADNRVRAQSLRGTGQELTHVGFVLQKTGTTTGEITVSLRSSLGGANLTSFNIATSEISLLRSEVYRALPSPVTLTAGSTYYLVLETTNNDPTNYYYLYDNWGTYVAGTDRYDPYRDGQEYRWDGFVWQSASYVDDDLYFRTNANANPRDDNGHGTHVGGIAAAEEGNGQGGVGVSFGADIMPLKSLDSTGGGTYANTVSGIYYAADNGAEVINMSLGGSTFAQAIQDAVDYAHAAGVIIFASVGNSGSTEISYPAGMDNVIGVGATTNQDLKAGFSNHNTSVDLTAPGQFVYATMPTYPAGLNSYGYAQDYDFLSGTSMSSPMAAGLAALVLSAEPRYTPAQVEQWMEDYADDLGAVGRDDYFGYGRINAFATLDNMPAFPHVDGLSPGSGPVDTEVTITGSAFGADRGASYVGFGGVQAVDYTSWSDTQVVCRVPAISSSQVQVSVTTSVGESNGMIFDVTPAVLALVPDSGGVGDAITIEGVDFGPVRGGSYVSFGGVQVQEYISWSDSGISCRVPPGVSGRVQVTATTGIGTSNGKAFSVIPRIDGLDPIFGPAGIEVTVSGIAFGPTRAGSSVSFGSVEVSDYSSWSDTEIVCRVPAGVYGDVQVSVTTEGGVSNGLLFFAGIDPAMRTWYLAEGSTAGGMETFILVQNPSEVEAEVQLTFVTESGTQAGPSAVLPPGTRFTWKANDYVDSYNVSTVVSSDQPVVAERSMYGAPQGQASRTWAHDSIGYSPQGP